MECYMGLPYDRSFEVVKRLNGNPTNAGRQLATAMANGYFGCRRYVVKYHEESGRFSIITDC